MLQKGLDSQLSKINTRYKPNYHTVQINNTGLEHKKTKPSMCG